MLFYNLKYYIYCVPLYAYFFPMAIPLCLQMRKLTGTLFVLQINWVNRSGIIQVKLVWPHLERLYGRLLVSKTVFVFGWHWGLSCGNPLSILHRGLFSLAFKKHKLSGNDFSVLVCFYFIRVTLNAVLINTEIQVGPDRFH